MLAAAWRAGCLCGGNYLVYNKDMQWRRVGLEMITLGTARGRVLAWGGLSGVIFVVPYHWLDHLSLWGGLGWHRAPSIGLTRAYWLLIHGQVAAAWHRNALIALVCAVGVPLIARDVWLSLIHI